MFPQALEGFRTHDRACRNTAVGTLAQPPISIIYAADLIKLGLFN